MKDRSNQIQHVHPPKADFVYSCCPKQSRLIWQRYTEMLQNAASGSFN